MSQGDNPPIDELLNALHRHARDQFSHCQMSDTQGLLIITVTNGPEPGSNPRLMLSCTDLPLFATAIAGSLLAEGPVGDFAKMVAAELSLNCQAIVEESE